MIERARGKKQVTETGGKTREEEEEDEKEKRGNPDLYVILQALNPLLLLSAPFLSSPLLSSSFFPPFPVLSWVPAATPISSSSSSLLPPITSH